MLKKICIVAIVIIFVCLPCYIYCSISRKTVEKGRFDNPKVCSTYLPYRESLIIFGGYNKNGTDNDVKLYDLDNKSINTIFKSNFNNSYNNFATLTKNNKNEDILINIQPIKFDKNAKYGIETYNFKTKELKTAKLPIKQRGHKENVRYSFYDNNIYILDSSKESEIISYNNDSLFYKKSVADLSNYGMVEGIVIGGIKNNVPQKTTSLKIMPEQMPLNLIQPVQNPEIYQLKHSFWQDNFWEQFIIVDKATANKFIQILSWHEDSGIKLIKMPSSLKHAKFIEAVNLSENELLLFYQKDSIVYVVCLSNTGIDHNVKIAAKIKSRYKEQKFLNINGKIYQIGGVKTNKPFNCGDKIENDMEISNLINQL